MTDYETPLMRDVEKLMMPIAIGLIIAFGLFFLVVFAGGEIRTNMQAFSEGYNIITDRDGSCFDNGVMRSCSGGAWPISILFVAPIPILIVVNIILWQFNKKQKENDKPNTKVYFPPLKTSICENSHHGYLYEGKTFCPTCGNKL